MRYYIPLDTFPENTIIRQQRSTQQSCDIFHEQKVSFRCEKNRSRVLVKTQAADGHREVMAVFLHTHTCADPSEPLKSSNGFRKMPVISCSTVVFFLSWQLCKIFRHTAVTRLRGDTGLESEKIAKKTIFQFCCCCIQDIFLHVLAKL